MRKESDSLELTSKQKTRLLRLGLEACDAVASSDEQKADLLYDFLKRALPTEASALDSLPSPLKSLSQKSGALAGVSIAELLNDSTVPITVVEQIKEYAKQSGKLAKSEYETEVLLSIYYAAIASGIVFHNRKITEHSYEHLEEAFGALAEKAWVSKKLRNLLLKAHEYTKTKK